MPSGSGGYYRCNVLYCSYQNLPSTVILSVRVGKKLSLVCLWAEFSDIRFTPLPYHIIQLSKRLITQPFYTSSHRIFPSSNPALSSSVLGAAIQRFSLLLCPSYLYLQREELQTGRHGLSIEPSALPADL